MIIGLAGKARSGKDSFADVLVEHLGFEKLFFAQNLKEMCKSVFHLTDYDVYEQKGKETSFYTPMTLTENHLEGVLKWIHTVTPDVKVADDGFTKSLLLLRNDVHFKSPRELLQYVGTEICRECYADTYHIDVVHAQIKNKNYVISDARFKNERAVIKEWEGFNIKVIDPDQEDETVGLSGHASEAEMDGDDYDVVFMNDKTLGLDMLSHRAQEVVKDLKESVFGKHS